MRAKLLLFCLLSSYSLSTLLDALISHLGRPIFAFSSKYTVGSTEHCQYCQSSIAIRLILQICYESGRIFLFFFVQYELLSICLSCLQCSALQMWTGLTTGGLFLAGNVYISKKLSICFCKCCFCFCRVKIFLLLHLSCSIEMRCTVTCEQFMTIRMDICVIRKQSGTIVEENCVIVW